MQDEPLSIYNTQPIRGACFANIVSTPRHTTRTAVAIRCSYSVIDETFRIISSGREIAFSGRPNNNY